MRFPAFGKYNRSHRESGDGGSRADTTSLNTYWLRSLFGVALVTLLAFAAGLFAWTRSEKAERLHELAGFSAVVADVVENRMASLQRRLRELGVDPRIREAFTAAGTEWPPAEPEWPERILPGMLRVRLVRAGACGGKLLPTQSFSYAGVDLICKAERQRRITLLEVHRLGNEDEHLAIAAPVLDAGGGTVLGVIHVVPEPSLLPSLNGANGKWGRMSYQQSVGDKVVTLGSAGGTTSPRHPDHQVSIEGTRLRVASWVDGSALDKVLLLQAVVAYLALMALVLLAMWLPFRGLRRAQASDYGVLVALVEGTANGEPLRPARYRLAETKPVVEALSGLLRRLHPARESGPPLPENEYPTPVEQAGTASKAAADESTSPTQQATNTVLPESPTAGSPILPTESVPAQIFRAYDIGGVVNPDLTTDLMYAIGLALGTEAEEAGDQTVIVGRDTRPSSKELSEPLVAGLRASGRDVLDLGMVPTPLVYFATRYQGETSGAMVTSSYNSESYIGLKAVVGGVSLAGERITKLRERILAGSFARGEGDYRTRAVVSDYVGQVEKDVAMARTLKVVVDCGNATAAVVAPGLYRALGCDLVELDCEPDAGFPVGKVLDPTHAEYLEDLQQAVVSQGADIGLIFDGDGDRLGVVDSSGKIIWPDRVLMLLAADVLSRYPGTDVIYDTKCSSHLAAQILLHGGRPVLWKSDHTSLTRKLEETGALLAGEWNGHIIFRERWYGFEDAFYAGARLLELLALDPRSSAEVFAALPGALATPELFLPLTGGEAAAIMKAVLEEAAQATAYDVSTDDGLRAESDNGWGYVRASPNQSALVFRFEAEDEAGLSELQDLFRSIMARAAPGRRLPF